MLTIPERLKSLLEKDSAFHGFVVSSFSNLTPWIADNKTPFFPEYTDHGFTHLNEVLLTADSLITDESWSCLSPQDAAAIIISVLLHDCAMHLSEEGFYSIVRGDWLGGISKYIGEEVAWPAVWAGFMGEAKRFDAKKLNQLFGDDKPVRDIPEDKLELNGRDKLLIGEFVRRHHARIAHEIAFSGVPGSTFDMKLAAEPEVGFLDLCGFIARSHNMGLRSAVDKLDPLKRQVHLNTHVPFLMLLLRVSDYMQIHSSRAPKGLLRIKTIVSPVSRGEWKKHSSIVEIHHAHTDPEAIYIDAEPKDAITFEGLRYLFSDMQRELDVSWSVLGEVYGRFPPLTSLGINIRRVRSSLDDLPEYQRLKKPEFIPKVLRFRTSDAEMMELLIAPLYGNSPAIGIRELLQNAVDACVELKDLVVKQQVNIAPELPEGVSITLNRDAPDGGGEIIIQDYGVGMTLEVVENYFLNVGASFRNSDRWKKDHQTQGRSNVYRTGRFGVGLLAAYLLGEEIDVVTRSVYEPPERGLNFSCRRGGAPIVVKYLNAEHGTKIRIKISSDVMDRLVQKPEDWDWFSLEFPKVARRLRSENEIVYEQFRYVPGADSELSGTDWKRVSCPGFDDVIWTYDGIKRREHSWGAILICNGVVVTQSFRMDIEISPKLNFFEVETPSLVVYDQDGRLPINLQRTDVVGRTLPFMGELAADIARYAVESIFDNLRAVDFSSRPAVLSFVKAFSVRGLEGTRYSRNAETAKFIYRSDGLIPVDYDVMAQSKIEYLFCEAVDSSIGSGMYINDDVNIPVDNYLFVDGITASKQARSLFVRRYFELLNDYRAFGIRTLPICGRRILIKDSDINELVIPRHIPKSFWNRLNLEWESDGWKLLSIGNVPSIPSNIDELVRSLNKSSSFGGTFLYFNWSDAPSSTEESPFAVAWNAANKGAAMYPNGEILL